MIDPKQNHETLQKIRTRLYIDVRTAEEFAHGHVLVPSTSRYVS
jgi:rhodanese-related sulfurtransferase